MWLMLMPSLCTASAMVDLVFIEQVVHILRKFSLNKKNTLKVFPAACIERKKYAEFVPQNYDNFLSQTLKLEEVECL